MAFAIRYRSRPPNCRKWLGRGEISCDHEQVSLRGRRHRLFMAARAQELTLPRAAFYNVERQKLSDPVIGQRVAETLVPPWQAALTRIDATSLPAGSRLEPLRADVLEYIQGQSFGLELIAEGSRRHEKDKIDWGVEDLQMRLARREAIQSLGRPLY